MDKFDNDDNNKTCKKLRTINIVLQKMYMGTADEIRLNKKYSLHINS